MATSPDNIVLHNPSSPFPTGWTLADVRHLLGDVPLHRILIEPTLGSATEADVERLHRTQRKLFELEYGILVEKSMGWYESILGVLIAHALRKYLDEHDLGHVLGADGLLKILPGVVKIPDVSFVAWSRFPNHRLPRTPIPELIPNLVVEILSESNTKEEMTHKMQCYFEAGVELIWYIDPRDRTAVAFCSPSESSHLTISDSLDGGSVLPDFSLNLQWLFDKADQQAAKQSQ